jgi:hypothetical protein
VEYELGIESPLSICLHYSRLYFAQVLTMLPQTVFAAIVLWAFGLGIIAGPVAGHFIDRATAKQCLSHDWPQEKDQLHRDWCLGNGYKI